MRFKAPGRICLFGEHQDYLGYPVIAAAINRYINVTSQKISEPFFKIKLPDIGKTIKLPISSQTDLPYKKEREYLKSSYNILRREGFKWDNNDNKGFEVIIKGSIPINAGASSSSAMIVAWIKFLSEIVNRDITPNKIAEIAYNAEVKEFKESGGMMDHFVSSLGGLIMMKTNPAFQVKKIKYIEENFKQSFILIDSKQRKDTVNDLYKIKQKSLRSFEEIKKYSPNFNMYSTTFEEIEIYLNKLSSGLRNALIANIYNRDLTLQALKILNRSESKILSISEKEALGNLIIEHHNQLSQNLGVSTKKIDEIVKLCMNNGACGAKINGSGFGGTVFAYCSTSDNRNKLISKLEEKKISNFPIEISNGVGEY
ncbi:MAG: mevalonate kinase family protein [Promethearchaeota archaeon]